MNESGLKKLKSVLGYTAAVLALAVVIATFAGQRQLSVALVSATGIKVSPWYTGGEVVKVVDHETYTTRIHRPVFDGLIGDRDEGFIQIRWEARSGLPPVIREEIGYSGKGRADFAVTLNTATGAATVAGYHPAVGPVIRAVRLDNGWVVRIALKKVS
jgi:hypothetical protein